MDNESYVQKGNKLATSPLTTSKRSADRSGTRKVYERLILRDSMGLEMYKDIRTLFIQFKVHTIIK